MHTACVVSKTKLIDFVIYKGHHLICLAIDFLQTLNHVNNFSFNNYIIL